MKTCSKCGVEKSLSDFRKGRTSCRACAYLYKREYDLLNPEKKIACDRRRYLNNKENLLTQRKEYRQNNPHLIAANNIARERSQKEATPSWARQGYIKLFYLMAKEEEIRTGKKIHVDHVIPLKNPLVCGLHNEFNLQLLFAEDNISKKNHFVVA